MFDALVLQSSQLLLSVFAHTELNLIFGGAFPIFALLLLGDLSSGMIKKGGEERETKAGRFQDLTSLPFPLAFSLPLVTSAVLHHTSRKNLLNAK